MKNNYRFVEVLALLFCGWSAQDLISSWGNSPFIRLGALTFIIWVIPLVTYWVLPTTKHEDRKINTPLLVVAVVVSLLGILGSINTLKHIALAIACWSFTPLNVRTIPWLLSAVTWMPATGYLLRSFPIETVVAGRVIVSVLGSIWGILVVYYGTKEEDEKK